MSGNVVSLHWSESMSVGHPVLDEQHKKLLALCVDTERISKSGSDTTTEEFAALLSEMIAYAAAHFEYEEEIIRTAGYPQCDDHIKEHRKFFAYLNALKTKQATSQALKDVKTFLMQWCVHHILKEDMGYKSSLTNKS